MIPLAYRLRDPVQLKRAPQGNWLVISPLPLAVLRINDAGARLVESTRGGASVPDMARSLGLSEEAVLGFCERLRERGFLEVSRAVLESTPCPTVTVIIPTRDRALELDECLAALSRLDYPREKIEVIVVDDGSSDPASVRKVTERRACRLLVNEKNRGPAYSRNRAAREASGEILAFIDSDCVPEPSWLKELTPYFLWQRVGAVGGRTLGYYNRSFLDRYEEVASPLDMGGHLRFEGRSTSSFYVPTCNLLVRTSLYRTLGGFREHLRVGEDVDLCLRLRESGAYLLYAPEGVVRHKHRRRLSQLLRQRADYGRSEAVLYRLHPEMRKSLPHELGALTTTLALTLGVARKDPRLLLLAGTVMAGSVLEKRRRVRKAGLVVSLRQASLSVLRGHLSMLYFVNFHLVRYHLLTLALLGLPFKRAWAVGGFATAVSGTVDYVVRQPRLPYPAYLACYLAEHVAYQLGVSVGCLKERTLRPYAIRVARGS